MACTSSRVVNPIHSPEAKYELGNTLGICFPGPGPVDSAPPQLAAEASRGLHFDALSLGGPLTGATFHVRDEQIAAHAAAAAANSGDRRPDLRPRRSVCRAPQPQRRGYRARARRQRQHASGRRAGGTLCQSAQVSCRAHRTAASQERNGHHFRGFTPLTQTPLHARPHTAQADARQFGRHR